MAPKAKPWFLAGALIKLRAQLDDAHPARNKKSDGTIGDAAHSSRTSDHNAWVIDSKGRRTVTAIDISHDPEHGVDCAKLSEIVKLDPRVKYVIWNRRIYNPSVVKRWRVYKGENPHTVHMHISVSAEERLFHDDRPWRIA